MQPNYVPSALPHRKSFCACLPPNLAVLGLTTSKKVFCLFAVNHADFSFIFIFIFILLRTFFRFCVTKLRCFLPIGPKTCFRLFVTKLACFEFYLTETFLRFCCQTALFSFHVFILKTCFRNFVAKLPCFQLFRTENMFSFVCH